MNAELQKGWRNKKTHINVVDTTAPTISKIYVLVNKSFLAEDFISLSRRFKWL